MVCCIIAIVSSGHFLEHLHHSIFFAFHKKISFHHKAVSIYAQCINLRYYTFLSYYLTKAVLSCQPFGIYTLHDF